jgi:hypothetical protein
VNSDVSVLKGCAIAFGDPEINDARHGPVVDERHQDVRRLQIAMDHALLMGVLHAFAQLDEQLESRPERHALSIAERRDRFPAHVFHDEVRPPLRRRPRVEYLGDAWVVHHRQRLPLDLEARDDARRVHAGLEDLDGDLAPHRLRLLGEPDFSHAAFT